MRYEEPWIIVGEEDPDVLTLRAEGVRWATDALRREYRFKDPDGIWTIWLFSGNDSYTRQALALFGDTPQTPYGYASSDHRALIMDISTGGGTLVHEMVHPMLHASMPTVPAWFNEGLASLYEQVREVDGRIYGDVNWRLGGVQESIRAGVLPSFGWLMRLDHETFYTLDPGTNYGQARYLAHHLQERGRLQAYYFALLSRRGGDPTGAESLAAVLGQDGLVGFQEQWEATVLALQPQ